MGFGGMSTGVPLVEVALVVLLGAESRARGMSVNEAGVANLGSYGSKST